jgi:ribonuclease III
MLLIRKSPYRDLEDKLGYRFSNEALLETALTHKSFRFENDGVDSDNQRLEFLGDALLGFIVAAELFARFGKMDEGALTAMRSQLASGKALANIAAHIHLGTHLKMGKGENQSGGRKRGSTLADAMEAVLGAAYLDGGIKAVQKIFEKLFVPAVESLSGDVWNENPKGQLQEYAQKEMKTSPKYRVVQREGLPHATIFTVEVSLIHAPVVGTGTGRSKQEAEISAARDLLAKLGLAPEALPRPPSLQRFTEILNPTI